MFIHGALRKKLHSVTHVLPFGEPSTRSARTRQALGPLLLHLLFNVIQTLLERLLLGASFPNHRSTGLFPTHTHTHSSLIRQHVKNNIYNNKINIKSFISL